MKRKGFKKPFHTFTCYGTILLLLSSCIGKNDVSVKLKHPRKNETSTSQPVTVSNIQVVNHQIIITGTNLASVSQFQIKEGSTNTNLQIESKTATTIVANTLSNVTFAAGKILDFIFTNAEAAATFTVNFSLCDSSLGGKGFNCTLTPNDKEVLSYDASSGKWQPRAVNGLSYIGSYDASSGANPAIKPAGQYYIISVAGDIDAGATILGVGDWIVSNGLAWQKIDNSTAIISVHGRTGVVVSDEGDYSLTQLSDATITAPINNQILKYNGTAWVNSDLSALGGGTVTSVSGAAPISITNGTSTPAISISQATTTTNGYLSSADWNTFNNKQATITAGTTAQYYRGDKSWQTLDTLAVPENTNLYFTNARALGVPLTGFAVDTNAIAATDTILQAFGKAQGQIDNLTSGGSNYLLKNGADTITGVVNVNTVGALAIGYTPTNMTDATSKSYVDAQRDSRVAKVGDTMTGDLQINTSLKLKDSGVNTVSLQAPTTITSSYVLKLPTAVGSNNQVLTTDASGNLSWTSPATSTAPNGSAGGDLSGSYPNPTIKANAITDSHIAANAISQSKINGLTTALSGKEPTITAGTTAQYLRGDKSLSTFADDVLATVLTGLSTATNMAITATDSVLVAFGKLQAQIGDHATSISNKADRTNVAQAITALTVTGLTGPIAGADATNKTYVDAQIAGASNQWTLTGSDVYRLNGNVGIGTNSPSGRLEVTDSFSGTVNPLRSAFKATITPSSSNGYSLFQGSGGTTFSGGTVYGLNLDLSGGTAGIQYGVYVNGEQRNYFSGNVGIGTTVPTANLQLGEVSSVNQDVNSMYVGSNQGGYAGGFYQKTGNYAVRSMFDSALGLFKIQNAPIGTLGAAITYSDRIVVNSSGNVGIGTTTPGTKLEVNGSVKYGNYISNVLNFVAGGWELGADRQYLRINTTIPWGDGPYVCVSAKGVDYSAAGSIDLQICWYMYSSTFYSPHVTSNGTITPSVSFANESGFVAILLDLGATKRWYHSTLQFDVLYRDTTNTSYFQNWTASEANFSGTATNIVGPLTANLGNRIFGGNVGIGTTSPTNKFQIGNSGHSNYSIATIGEQYGAVIQTGETTSPTTGPALWVRNKNNGGTPTDVIYAQNNGNVGIGTSNPAYKLDVGGSGNFTTSLAGGIQLALGNTTMTSTNKRLRFIQDNASTVTRVSNDADSITYMSYQMDTGNIGIGTTSPSYKLDVQGGNVNSAGAYTNVSDIRLKQEIEPLENSLEKILQLRSVSYYWKDQSFDSSKQVGFIAQEVEKVFPEVVKTDSLGFKAMSYSQLVSPVVDAIKELYRKWFDDSKAIHREIASVKADSAAKDKKIKELEKENAAIKARLDRIEKELNSK